MRVRFVVVLVAVAVAVAVAGGSFARRGGAGPVASPPPPSPRVAVEPVEATELSPSASPSGASAPSSAPSPESIAFWEARVEANEDDYLSRTVLAQLLIEEARATHNLVLVSNAEHHLERALAVNPDHGLARGLAAVARSVFHDFGTARDLASEAFADDPDNLIALSAAGDAALDLGDHEEARLLFDQLEARLGSVPAVTSRQARLAAAQGSTEPALLLASAAVRDSGGESAQRRAYYLLLLGSFQQRAGEHDDAATSFELSLSHAPDYGAAIESLARTRAAQGRYDESAALWERSGELIGIPDFHVLAALGDLAARSGDVTGAERLWAEALTAAESIPADQQVGLLRDVARFRADHDLDPAAAVQLAREDLELRSDPYAYDTLAWALAAAGDLEGAAAAIEPALVLGSADTAVAYHAAVIFDALGDRDRARDLLAPALRRDANFEVLGAGRAAALLDRLS